MHRFLAIKRNGSSFRERSLCPPLFDRRRIPRSRAHLAIAALLVAGILGCISRDRDPLPRLPPAPDFPPDHPYTLDDLVAVSIHRNASIDVARYEAQAAQGLVDQVKALWLPIVRFDFAAIGYHNDVSYEARAFDIASINVPITGAYNILNSLNVAQIISTGGKRLSGLKQATMFAAIKRLDALRQQDSVAFDVATYYHLTCLTNDIDAVIDDTLRRLRVLRQVSAELNRRGSLRGNLPDTLLAEFLVLQLEQLRIGIQAGRQQAFSALRQAAGIARDEPLRLKRASLPPALTPAESLSVYASIARAFLVRPETQQVNLFTKIRQEQVTFAKAAWSPNVLFAGSALSVAGNHHTIANALQGLVASFVVDLPVYDPSRRGKLREALGLEQASLAFQRQVEELITLQVEVAAVDCQRAMAALLKAENAQRSAAEHFDATRHAYSRELVHASDVVTALALDMIARIQHRTALFAFHDCKARLKRVTADREATYGY